jgi:hypothetical protein
VIRGYGLSSTPNFGDATLVETGFAAARAWRHWVNDEPLGSNPLNIRARRTFSNYCWQQGWLLKNSLPKNQQKLKRVRKLCRRFSSAT